jgi:hypothetical protein
MPFADATTPLWTRPRCGHRFVTRNIWHSCTQFELSHHFDGKAARVRELFDAWYVCYFRLTDRKQLDGKMKEYVREAHQVGRQLQK